MSWDKELNNDKNSTSDRSSVAYFRSSSCVAFRTRCAPPGLIGRNLAIPDPCSRPHHFVVRPTHAPVPSLASHSLVGPTAGWLDLKAKKATFTGKYGLRQISGLKTTRNQRNVVSDSTIYTSSSVLASGTQDLEEFRGLLLESFLLENGPQHDDDSCRADQTAGSPAMLGAMRDVADVSSQASEPRVFAKR